MVRSFIALVILVGVACLPVAEAGPKDGKTDIRGTIKNVRKAEGKVLAVVLIEGKMDKDTGYDKAVVKITKETKLVRVGAKDRRAATIKDLREGVRVEATFTGPVAESYPVQAAAGVVRIFEEK